jgi:hypothetical protein
MSLVSWIKRLCRRRPGPGDRRTAEGAAAAVGGIVAGSAGAAAPPPPHTGG